MRDFGCSIYLSLSLLLYLASLNVVLVDYELKSSIFVIFKVFEPIMEIVSESLVWFN